MQMCSNRRWTRCHDAVHHRQHQRQEPDRSRAGYYQFEDPPPRNTTETRMAGRMGGVQYFSAFNHRPTDGFHLAVPYDKLVSDHGQIMAHLMLGDPDA